ncbi:MAG: response regulator [Sphingomonas sp.]|nr:response regulator [Sphingomonas sp.]
MPARLGGWRTAPLAIFAVAVLIVLGGVFIIVQTEINYRQNRAQQTLVQAEILAESVAAALDFDDAAAAQGSVNALRANRQVRWVGVYDETGRAVAGYGRSGTASPSAERSMPEAGSRAIRVTAPVSLAGQRIGTVHLEVDREPVSRRVLRNALLAILIVLAALVVTALGLAQVALRRANRELAARADALAQANEMLAEQMEERGKAEEQLRQSQKMQALGQLTGGIAHDFNNLLTVIQGSADMLCREDLPEAKRVRFAQAIVQASGTAAALTSQLLAFARRQPLKPERIDLNEVIGEMRDLIAGTMGVRIDLTTDLWPSSCTVEVDRTQLQSAILNIASNARDAMPGGGRLTIGTSEVTSGSGDPMIAVEIADTGHGMDAETLDRIFEPFFTTKATGKGTGLGLSQVYGFVSQSGGDIQVRSNFAEGTVMTLTLPCSESDDPALPRAQSSPAADQPSAAILVVEDNEEVGAFAETLLTDLGHIVTRARSGEEALELTRARPFDIVFSDVIMPGMGGLKLAEHLAEEQPDLPVVLATGYSQEIAETGSGGRPVILKPYRLATLSEALAAALQDKLT